MHFKAFKGQVKHFLGTAILGERPLILYLLKLANEWRGTVVHSLLNGRAQ